MENSIKKMFFFIETFPNFFLEKIILYNII
jgi:hypothetical protein